jgi:hypothetical protein
MTFGYFIIASFLNPHNLIHILVPPVIHQLQGDSVLGIDSPQGTKVLLFAAWSQAGL